MPGKREHGTTAQQGDDKEDELQCAQQAAIAQRISRAAPEAGGLARDRKGKAHIQQIEPSLQHGEKAHQSVGFRAHVLQVQRQDDNADQRDVCLACVAREDVFFQ